MMVRISNKTTLKIQNIFVGLKSKGFSPVVNESGFITLPIDDSVYLVLIDDTDEGYLQIILPAFYLEKTGTYSNQGKLMLAANFANVESKLARCYCVDGRVSASVDVLVASLAQFVEDFKRYISALDYCRSRFIGALNRQV
ncbi:hypothetical protein [Janthinobacterium lividum]|uniref:hypothetical protein n=1 Tax=Janthinobacterium lividum TaxID=29581 RepID=UPI000B1ACE53|nr:hypothetical protein [Janthinobacterium lividum]